jgi:hypothetical protein
MSEKGSIKQAHAIFLERAGTLRFSFLLQLNEHGQFSGSVRIETQNEDDFPIETYINASHDPNTRELTFIFDILSEDTE